MSLPFSLLVGKNVMASLVELGKNAQLSEYSLLPYLVRKTQGDRVLSPPRGDEGQTLAAAILSLYASLLSPPSSPRVRPGKSLAVTGGGGGGLLSLRT